ncbi:DUF4270 domain-containing protein [uncultured Bacteroides sp.]|uniref:DUF4270 domain-containing protein n=1 Tax=uncultured Bacteroides sp. TaxID=162156 RepID=UPI002AA7E783|nr:DUF4270 domain-containing protein [uncultured Bacteroides sp.]
MKVKHLWIITLILAFFGCDDNTGNLGLGMLPGSDKIAVATTTFDVSTQSILAGPVFAKTSSGYVGKFTDPEFGFYESGFLTQLNCTDSLKFPYNVMAGDTAYVAELVLYYSHYFGDSLNACRMSVYQLNKTLDKNRYTDIDPEKYYSKDNLLGRKAYTAVDLSISDSLRATSDFYPYIRFVLPKKFGDDIIKKNKENPEFFYNADAFIKNIFKGIYVKSDYGDGTILYIDQVNLNIVFNCHYTDSLGHFLKKQDGTDSLYYGKRTFAATKEVIQANQFTNSDKLQAKVNEKDWTYIKSPAGIFTEATLPIQEIDNKLSQDTLNVVKLNLVYYAQKKENQFSMSPPDYLLLVREKDMKTFFENNQLPDNVTSFLAQRNTSGTNQYTYSNLSRLITTCVAEKNEAKKKAGSSWNEQQWTESNPLWNKIVVIPVAVNTTQDTSGNVTIASIQNDMKPSYVKLKGGANTKLKLEVTYSQFNK